MKLKGLKILKLSAQALLALTLVIPTAHAATEITGAGSTFVYPVLSKWSASYKTKKSVKVNYQSIGSGGGIAQIKAGTVDFAASDKPLSSAELNKLKIGQFPSVIGGIVVVIHIDGIKSTQLKLTGPVLANIYLGKIKLWNDPQIKALNPHLKLPKTEIAVVHRSDRSGTTFNFVNYLSKVSSEWKAKVGEGTSVAWPTGLGGKGNEGVAAYVKQFKNSIGYVEYAYVIQNKMSYVLLQNKAGKFVRPSSKSFQAAAATADWSKAKDFDLVMTNAPGKNAYPITATTFIIMHKNLKNIARNQAVFDFFKWAFENGQTQANSLDYVPLPISLVKQIKAYWRTEFNFES